MRACTRTQRGVWGIAEEENLPTSAYILNTHCANSGYCSDPRDSEATSSQQEARQKNGDDAVAVKERG